MNFVSLWIKLCVQIPRRLQKCSLQLGIYRLHKVPIRYIIDDLSSFVCLFVLCFLVLCVERSDSFPDLGSSLFLSLISGSFSDRVFYTSYPCLICVIFSFSWDTIHDIIPIRFPRYLGSLLLVSHSPPLPLQLSHDPVRRTWQCFGGYQCGPGRSSSEGELMY